jgi:hypothetical protein
LTILLLRADTSTQLLIRKDYQKGIGMNITYRLLVLAFGLLIVGGCSEDDKPSVEQVEPALKTYLVLEKAKTCGGTVAVDWVSIHKIGDYESNLVGYPVYATFGVTCSEGSPWVSNDTSTANFTTVVRKKMSGEFECFMPEHFQQRRNAMERQTDALPQDLLKTDAPKPITAPR